MGSWVPVCSAQAGTAYEFVLKIALSDLSNSDHNLETGCILVQRNMIAFIFMIVFVVMAFLVKSLQDYSLCYCRGNVEKKTVLENLDLVLLAMDETVDGGYVMLHIRGLSSFSSHGKDGSDCVHSLMGMNWPKFPCMWQIWGDFKFRDFLSGGDVQDHPGD